jgi:signal transduction histidine kinase
MPREPVWSSISRLAGLARSWRSSPAGGRWSRRAASRMNPRSLRYRVLVLVVAVVVLPLLYVWVAGIWERSEQRYEQRSLRRASTRIVHALDRGDPLRPLARAHRVHLRVLSRDGVVLTSIDETDDVSLLAPVSEPFWGPAGRPSLRQADRAAAPLPDRPEVVASAEGPATDCAVVDDGRVLMCSAAQRLPDGRIVHVMRGTPRLVTALYDERFELTALTLIVLTIGVGLALWLGWRMVRPIEQLRDQVVERTRGRVSTDPIVLDRPDEAGDLARAFNQLLQALDERYRANTEFAADFAHELKSPLALARSVAEELAEDGVGGDRIGEARRAALHRTLGDAVDRMDEVVHQFLELARAEGGMAGTVRDRIDLFELVANRVHALRLDPRYPGLEVELTGEPAEVVVVIERLETAARNLLDNAAAFARTTVRVTVRRADRWVELVVADDGPGIPHEEQAALFTRYRSRRKGGTGLGLAMTKAIVEGHGGTITVESEDGRGSSFRIRLPGI